MNIDSNLVPSVEIIATGVPCSGTLFLAHILGWNHELAYGIHNKGNGPLREGPAKAPEVSWLAAPHLKNRKAFVIHIVRDPKKVVRSNIASGWLRPGNPWGDYAYKYTETWDPWVFWLKWIKLCESVATTRISLEDISHLGSPINVGVDSLKTLIPPIPVKYDDDVNQMIEYLGYKL